MTKKKLPVRFTGQHFTIDKVLIEDAIKQCINYVSYEIKRIEIISCEGMNFWCTS